MYEVIAYAKPNGDVPVEMFLDSLPVKLREKTLRSLLVLREYGVELQGDKVKYLREGIYELRSRFGGDITRVFYFYFDGKRIVLTNGFVKKTRKTPRGEIERALAYKRDWEARNANMEA